LRYIVQYLGKTFDEDRFNGELTDGECCVLKAPIEKEIGKINKIREAMHTHEKEYYQDIYDGKPHESFWHMPHSMWDRKRK
jgi:malate dehydrogenase (quinone)